MNDWFIWNGTKCTDYGIHVTEIPSITRPEERVTFTDIPGRSGSLTLPEGEDVYKDMTLTATCIIEDSKRIPEICGWLKGSSKVTFANRQGGFYYARVANQIPFDRILRGNPHLSFAVNFRCKPFWYLEDDEEITIAASGDFIKNPGTVHSEPVITVEGAGEITLMIGMNIIELSDIEDKIVLDTPLMEAYKDTMSLNSHMSGDFPTLSPGSTAISWSGDVSKVTVKPNWRYL